MHNVRRGRRNQSSTVNSSSALAIDEGPSDDEYNQNADLFSSFITGIAGNSNSEIINASETKTLTQELNLYETKVTLIYDQAKTLGAKFDLTATCFWVSRNRIFVETLK